VSEPTFSREDAIPGSPSRAERRAVVRYLLRRPAQFDGDAAEPGARRSATVRDLSPAGVGLELACRLPVGAVLAVTPLGEGQGSPRLLLARVLYCRREAAGWFCGCELANRLSDEDLHTWLG
jgi:hypothetical protein